MKLRSTNRLQNLAHLTSQSCIDGSFCTPSGFDRIESLLQTRSIKSPARPLVEVDCERLVFPHSTDTSAIPQTARNAKSLVAWLTRATGKTTAVPLPVAVVWYVVRKSGARIRVLNEKKGRCNFPIRKPVSYSPERLQRIVHQLTER